jgi:AraC-like DNA-binding protein
MPAPGYLEHAPSSALAGCVECLWTLRSERAEALSRVLPDGCMDLLFDLMDGRGFAVGAMTRALPVRLSGRVEILGVRFRPGGAASLLGIPAGELTDLTVALEDLGSDLRECRRVLDADSAHAALPAAMEVLGGLRAREPEPLAGAAWARLASAAGAVPVRALAAELGVGERRLQRVFHDHVGLTPKEAARVARLRAALAILRADSALPLGRAALRAGYFDQAHFNREFARLVGVAPGAWRAELVGSVQAADAREP